MSFTDTFIKNTDPYYFTHCYARILNNTVDSRVLRKTCKRLGLPRYAAKTWTRTKLRTFVRQRTPKYIRTLFYKKSTAKQHKQLLKLCRERDRVNGAAPLAFYKASKRYIRRLSKADRQLLWRHTVTPLRPGPKQDRLNQLIRDAPRLTHDLVVFRGMRVKSITSIETRRHRKLQSLSLGPEHVFAFARGQCCLLVLTLPRGIPALSLTPLMHYVSYEDEVLVPREIQWTALRRDEVAKNVIRGVAREEPIGDRSV